MQNYSIKKEGTIIHTQEKRQSVETDHKLIQTLELAGRESKAAITAKEGNGRTYRREMETRKIKKNQMEIPELKKLNI